MRSDCLDSLAYPESGIRRLDNQCHELSIGPVELAEHDVLIGDAAIGDPRLRSVDHVIISVETCSRRHSSDVGPCLRLRYRKR